MIELLEYEFMRNALLAAVMVGIASGIVGTFVVVKRIVSLSGGIAHTSFGGIGLGYLLGINPLIMAIPWSILSALGIGILSKEAKISEDTSIGMLWALGMALGVLFIFLSSGYAPDLFSYLFGNILSVPFEELLIMGAMNLAIILFTIYFYKELKAIAFDEKFAKVRGVPTRKLYLLLLCMVALSIVIMIKIVGIVLVIALLSLPAAIALQHTKSLERAMAYSSACAIVLSVGGLLLSYALDLPSGATIIILLSLVFGISNLWKRSRE
jgi:zinc transport system permease protein